jgi:hypothetical protein
MESKTKQLKLGQDQIKAFHYDGFVDIQIDHFMHLTDIQKINRNKYIVDIGGGCGFFAEALHRRLGFSIRVIDSDKKSIDIVEKKFNKAIEGTLGDALMLNPKGDEGIVCFNLLLHHLIGKTEVETRDLQKKAIMIWLKNVDFIFINEYIYESFIKNISGRLIFRITSSKLLSAIAKIVSKVIPSFRANTFGVGVRFRSHSEWITLFEECGCNLVSRVYGTPQLIANPLRLLLIKQIRLDSFLLAKPNQETGGML